MKIKWVTKYINAYKVHVVSVMVSKIDYRPNTNQHLSASRFEGMVWEIESTWERLSKIQAGLLLLSIQVGNFLSKLNLQILQRRLTRAVAMAKAATFERAL